MKNIFTKIVIIFSLSFLFFSQSSAQSMTAESITTQPEYCSYQNVGTSRTNILKFQRQFSILPVGILGPVTKKRINQLCSQQQNLHECCVAYAPKYCTYAKVNCTQPLVPVESGNTPNCKVWYDGCNTCSRAQVGGQQMCTLMACVQGGNDAWFAANKPYCREYFSNKVNTRPTIKSFTGPAKLNLNQTGTWKIDASIFNNQPLTYNVTWGDEVNNDLFKMSAAPTSMNSVVVQKTTFEHAYNKPGTYIVTVEVKSQDGQVTKTTQSVSVVQNVVYNKCLDGGVYHNEGTQLTCRNTGGGQLGPCIANAYFVCRNGEWKIEGEYILNLNGVSDVQVSNANTSCITPWGNQTVLTGNFITRDPYFTNGVYSRALVNMFAKCQDEKWLMCDNLKNNCTAI